MMVRIAAPEEGMSVYDPCCGSRGRLCLAVAKAEGWTCVSNDKQLRAECEREEVKVLWGFQVLALLVDARALDAADARTIANNIAAANKRTGAAVLALFLASLGGKTPKR